MAAGLTGTSKTVVNMTPTASFGSTGDTLSAARSYTHQQTWTSGTGAGAVNTYFEDDRSLADGASETLDLSGTLASAFATAVFARVKEIIIVNKGTTVLTIGNATAPVQMGFGAAANTWGIPPGGKFHVTNPTAAGWTVTNTTADGLKIANAAGAAGSYKVIINGADA